MPSKRVLSLLWTRACLIYSRGRWSVPSLWSCPSLCIWLASNFSVRSRVTILPWTSRLGTSKSVSTWGADSMKDRGEETLNVWANWDSKTLGRNKRRLRQQISRFHRIARCRLEWIQYKGIGSGPRSTPTNLVPCGLPVTKARYSPSSTMLKSA